MYGAVLLALVALAIYLGYRFLNPRKPKRSAVHPGQAESRYASDGFDGSDDYVLHTSMIAAAAHHATALSDDQSESDCNSPDDHDTDSGSDCSSDPD